MDTVRLSSGSMNENQSFSRSSGTVTKRMPAQQAAPQRKATALIHKAAPDYGNGNGKLVNLYA